MNVSKLLWVPVAALFVGCASGDRDTTPSLTVRKVKTVEVAATDADSKLVFPGKVVSDDHFNVAFKTSGRIAALSVAEGDRVAKGQLIGALDPADYQVALDAAQAEYNSVKAEADRVIALYNDSATTAINYEKAVYGLQQITAKLAHARDQLDETRLKAPASGTVKTLYRRQGEVVGAGMPVVEIVDDAKPVVEIKIPAVDYVDRPNFVAYACRFDVFPDKVFALKPVSVSSVANANQLYTLKLAFVDAAKPLPSVGMSTTVEIIRSREPYKQNAVETDAPAEWVVPTTAIGADGDWRFVYVVAPDSLLRKVPVDVERLTPDGNAVVTSKVSLAEASVVAAGVGALSEGERVCPIEPVKPSNVGGLL